MRAERRALNKGGLLAAVPSLRVKAAGVDAAGCRPVSLRRLTPFPTPLWCRSKHRQTLQQ